MTASRRLGATDLRLAPLVLGGNVFGWTADRDASFAVLDGFVAGARDNGPAMIDTADVYSAWVDGHRGGESETVIGEWLRASGRRADVLIATKCGMLPVDGEMLSPANIAAACDASLRRLGVDVIDLYYAHRDDPDVPQAEVLGAFGRLVEAGKIRVVGVSNFTAARLRSALDLSQGGALPRVGALQPEYNLISRDDFEGDLQDLAVREDVAVLPYYGLAAGFLTGKYRSDADLSKSVRSGRMADWPTKFGPTLAAMDAVAAETGASLATIALAWLLAQPGITAPIASASKPEQLPDLLAAMTLKLTGDQLARLTDAGT